MTRSIPGHKKIFIWDTETGERLERSAVDAKEMSKRFPDRYTLDDPEGGRGATAPEAASPPDPGSPVIPGLAQQPQEHSEGVPLNPTSADDAGDAKALDLPEDSTPKPKKSKSKKK